MDQLKNDQKLFKGDWWQLALLIQNLKEDERTPDINDEDRLKQWNEWRKSESSQRGMRPWQVIHLEYATLSLEKLTNANLKHATLTGANLCNAKLEKANLWGATLTNADLRGAKDLYFDSNRIDGIHIEGNVPDP